jgi:NAD(P)-dependent dehydrogenase (short-subunit alcohol dehydrogenase family)
MSSNRSRVTFLTGAGARIGRAVDEKLVSNGESVVVNDLDGKAADQVVEGIVESGGRAVAAPGDVSDAYVVQEAVAKA